MLFTVSVFSQQMNQSNEAVVTIVGNAPDANNTNDFVNTNPYAGNNDNNAPQMQQQLSAQNNNIEPTLENGFHVRFEVNSQQAVEPTSIAGFAPVSASSSGSSGSGYSSGKSRKHGVTMAERTFNAKKKFRSKVPKRKKKYHPHLCGRF
jgi:hypothetical protein